MHAVVARSTFRSKHVKNTSTTDYFWKLRCRKSARRCGAKHISKSKCTKHTRSGPLLEVEMSKKCTPLWRGAHFEVKMYKTHQVRTTFWRSDVVSRGRRKGLCTVSKVGHLTRICKDAFSVAGAIQETCSPEMLGGQGADFLRGVEFWSIRSSGLLRCRLSYDLASLFRGRRSTSDRWSAKIAKRMGTRPSALHSTFHFWRKSCRIVSFFMLSTSKNEEVSQNCFVFDVVKFKKWGSLAELLRFWCCQVQKLRKSCRIASLASLQADR